MPSRNGGIRGGRRRADPICLERTSENQSNPIRSPVCGRIESFLEWLREWSWRDPEVQNSAGQGVEKIADVKFNLCQGEFRCFPS